MTFKKFVLPVIYFILLLINIHAQKFEGLAKTPPMGWNSWNHFGCNINEKIIREIADEMVENGMKDAGYKYINIDDCWHGERDSLGFIHPDPVHFPSGMKAVADYVHSKGLKLGIYSDAGWKTCAKRPGSRGHEYQDALMYAKWGIDYLKYDWCYTNGLNPVGAYLTMRDAIYDAGRPIVLSICEWGNHKPWEWGDSIGHLWRTTGDIYPCFNCIIDHGNWAQSGVLQILELRNNDTLRKYSGTDQWNDPDMMEVGNGMTVNEDRAHFSMWCMLAAPLIAGNDLREMNKETFEILTNIEVIAVDQDRLGIQAFKYDETDSLDVWVKPLLNDELAICFLNKSIKDKKIQFDWYANRIEDHLNGYKYDFNKTVYAIRDLWKHKENGLTDKIIKIDVKSHDIIMYRLIPIGKYE